MRRFFRHARLQSAKAADEAWPSLIALCQRLRSSSTTWPAEFEELITWYSPQLERLYDDVAPRLQDLTQLQGIAGSYPSRERFLTDLTLDPPAATSGEAGPPLLDEDYLTLSTIHSAKGQEWKVVQILNCVDGCIPSDMAAGNAEDLEEERRLLYVAMTRARDTLVLLSPQRFYVDQQRMHGDRHVYAARSRFLTEGVCEHFSQESWQPRSAAVEVPASRRVSVDLRAVLRGAWARCRHPRRNLDARTDWPFTIQCRAATDRLSAPHSSSKKSFSSSSAWRGSPIRRLK